MCDCICISVCACVCVWVGGRGGEKDRGEGAPEIKGRGILSPPFFPSMRGKTKHMTCTEAPG